MTRNTRTEARRGRRSRDRAEPALAAPPEGATGHRHARLEQVIGEELNALARDELSDPRLENVRFTRVELSVDYKSARVRFATEVPSAPRQVERALVHATPFLRARLAEAIALKHVPALRFVRDAFGDSLDVDADADADPDPVGR